MYCWSCGAESAPGVQYCKRCGANLSLAGSSSPGRPQGILLVVLLGIATLAGLPIGGISIVFEEIPDLLGKGLPLSLLLVLAIAGLLMVSQAALMLGRLLTPVFKTYLQSGDPSEQNHSRVSARPRRPINAPYDSISSVTEETTRAFEPAPGADRDTH